MSKRKLFSVLFVFSLLLVNNLYAASDSLLLKIHLKDKFNGRYLNGNTVQIRLSDDLGHTRETSTKDSIVVVSVCKTNKYFIQCISHDYYLAKNYYYPNPNLTKDDIVFYLTKVNKTIEEFPTFYFDNNKFNFNIRDSMEINFVFGTLYSNPTYKISINGYSDFCEKSPNKISQRRSLSIYKQLLKMGVSKDRMVLKGGAYKPNLLTEDKDEFKAGTELNENYISSLKDDNAKKRARKLNRRVEINLLR